MKIMFYAILLCSRPTLKVFIANNRNAEQIAIGDVITYKCLSFSPKGLPKQATIVRKREDITWEEVLADEAQ